MALWLLDTIEINGGFLPGLNLSFPPGLTCIIGPRGSGKSTLAEAIRYALGNTRSGSRTARDLIENNLSNAVIAIRTKSGEDGACYLVRRSGKQGPSLSSSSGQPIAGVDLERGSFLPLDAFSSNEIEDIADASLGEKRRALLDDLRGEELAHIQIAIADRQRALDANRDAIRLARNMLAGLRERIEELGDAPARLAALPPPADNEGGAGITRLAKQKQANEQELLAIEEVSRAVELNRQAIDQLAAACAATDTSVVQLAESANTDMMSEFRTQVKDRRRTAKALLSQASEQLAAISDVVATFRPRLAERHAVQNAEFLRVQQKNIAASEAVQKRTAAEQAVAQLGALQEQLKTEGRRLQQLLDERKTLKGAYLIERERVSSLRHQVAEQLQKEAGEKVRIRVLRNADSQAYQQILASGLQGARVRNHEDILVALMQLRPEDLAQLIQDNDSDEFEVQTALGTERAKKILESFRDKIDPMELETVTIDDRICIELNVASLAEPHYKDAAELSRGQKCTALLPLLLARREVPLIIDQPEDNLDNHFIFETVVETIGRMKTRRQLIFITHNANIPVLGEADQVVVMESDGRRGFVSKFGSVDDCRDEIIDLLEGGRQAFELRRRRYGTG